MGNAGLSPLSHGVCVFPGSSSSNRLYGIPLLDYTVTCLDIYSRAGLQHQTQTRGLSPHQHIQKTAPYLRPHPWLRYPTLSTYPKLPRTKRTLQLWEKAGANWSKGCGCLCFPGCVFGVMPRADKRRGCERVMINDQDHISSRLCMCVAVSQEENLKSATQSSAFLHFYP